jgi:hypothetical protein
MKANPKNKTKQQKLLKKKTLAALGAIFVGFGLSASVSGTIAWFTYSSHTYVDFEGTTVGGLGMMEIGIRSKLPLNASLIDINGEHGFIDGYALTDGGEYKSIYWTGSELTPDLINVILEGNGSATNTLCPVTTGSNTYNNVKFYTSPTPYSKEWRKDAKLDEYLTLPLAFRVSHEEEPEKYLAGEPIYLSMVDLEAQKQDSSIHQALRFYVKDEVDGEYVINPSDQLDGNTIVGGRLDLDGNGYYDTFEENGNTFEMYYGEITQTPSSADWTYITEDEVFSGEKSTFDANSKGGTFKFNNNNRAVAPYKGFRDFRLENNTIARTKANGSTNKDVYATLDLVAFIEGWDLNVIDKEKENLFNLNMLFECDI